MGSFRADGASDGEFPAPAGFGDVFLAAGFWWACQEAPCIAVFFQEAVASSVGVEAEALAGGGGLDWDDVPEIERDHVSSDEVDFFGGIGLAVASGVVDAVAAFTVSLSTLDLDAPERAKESDQDVVGFAFSPRLGDG